MQNIIAPVEWKNNKRTLRSKKDTLTYAKRHLKPKEVPLSFLLVRLDQRTGLKLKERPWFTSAVKLALKYDIPLIPINIKARNSFLFYLFDFTYEVEIKEKVYLKDLPKDFD
tara:strand:- start:558 stop:893 length:336 start_codon:yes stop_codon:yes gene_type:complete